MIDPHTDFDFDAIDGRPEPDSDGAASELVVLRGMIEAAATSETPETCFAAMLVIMGRFTAAEAAKRFKKSHSTVQRAIARLRSDIRTRAIVEDSRANVRRTSHDLNKTQRSSG